MRLIDADAYAAEMKKRQDKAAKMYKKAYKAKNNGRQHYASGAFTSFVEAKLTLDKMPTVDAVPVVRCKDCKKKENCKYPATWNWCPDGERKEKTDG